MGLGFVSQRQRELAEASGTAPKKRQKRVRPPSARRLARRAAHCIVIGCSLCQFVPKHSKQTHRSRFAPHGRECAEGVGALQAKSSGVALTAAEAVRPVIDKFSKSNKLNYSVSTPSTPLVPRVVSGL